MPPVTPQPHAFSVQVNGNHRAHADNAFVLGRTSHVFHGAFHQGSNDLVLQAFFRKLHRTRFVIVLKHVAVKTEEQLLRWLYGFGVTAIRAFCPPARNLDVRFDRLTFGIPVPGLFQVAACVHLGRHIAYPFRMGLVVLVLCQHGSACNNVEIHHDSYGANFVLIPNAENPKRQ